MLLLNIIHSTGADHTFYADEPLDPVQKATKSLREYEETGRRLVLESAIGQLRDALVSADHDSKRALCINAALCDALCELFDVWGREDAIEEAVRIADQLWKSESHTNIAEEYLLYCTARAHVLHYEASTEAADIEAVLRYFEGKNDLVDVVRPEVLMVWSRAVYWDYNTKRDVGLLETAMAYQEAALKRLPTISSKRPLCTIYLSDTYRTRYSRLLNPSDCAKVEELAHSSLDSADITDPRRARYFVVLGMATNMEYHHGHKLEYLDISLSWCRSALESATQDDRMLPFILTVYAAGLREFYLQKGNITDIDESVAQFHKALGLTKETTSAYLPLLYNMSMTLMQRFEHVGRLVDADLAISLMRRYRDGELQEGKRPSELQSYVCMQLSSCLVSRYRVTNHPPDLLEGLKISLDVLNATPDHPVHLENVAQIYYFVYLHTRSGSDLDKALEYFIQADQPDGRERIGDLWEHYMTYGKASIAFARVRGPLSYVESGLTLLRTALTYSPPGHRARTEVLLALGDALMDCYRAGEGMAYLKEATVVLTQALDEEPPSIRRAKCATALAEATLATFARGGDNEDFEMTLRLLKQAADDENGLIRDRFDAALNLARLAQVHHRYKISFESYCLAVDLLPRLAWLGSERDERLLELRTRAPSLAVDAAAAAIHVGELERAVELLETGRGVFWSQILQLRGDSDDLRRLPPKLAAELEAVGRILDAQPSVSGDTSTEQLLQRQRRLAERWDSLVDEIRTIEGFESFLKPAPFSQLATAGAEGPVIIFNASAARCDALIITLDNGSQHCVFPEGTFEMIAERATHMNQALTLARDSRGMAFLNAFLQVLLDELWVAILQPVMWALQDMYAGGLPERVWLCPTGPFCFLPLHAARPADPSAPGLVDLVTCSYTSTLAVLIRARSAHRITESSKPTVLAVSQPMTPGHPPLPYSLSEVEGLMFTPLAPYTTTLIGEEATAERVLDGVKEHAWVHLSCHGSSNTRHPLKSCFRLHDGPLTLSKISELRLPGADFAFLSACHTARGIGALPDESLHLAAGLQLAGFKSVIATLWGIADRDAPTVSAIVYSHMLRDDKCDIKSGAKGLNNAIKALQREGVGPIRWVPFIHLGL